MLESPSVAGFTYDYPSIPGFRGEDVIESKKVLPKPAFYKIVQVVLVPFMR